MNWTKKDERFFHIGTSACWFLLGALVVLFFTPEACWL